jgi:acyl-CoA thioester hydrolase
MPAIYEYPVTVVESDIDAMNHANNLRYLAWAQAAASAHSLAQGWPLERYKQLGMGWVVRSHEIRYLMSAVLGDELVVRTWVSEFRRVSSFRKYKIIRLRDQALMAAATTEFAFIDFAKGAPTRIDPQVAADFIVSSG